jgi:hypothetical protein
MKDKVVTEKNSLNGKSRKNSPFLSHLKRQKYAHVDEYDPNVDLAELDFGDGFNAFDEDFYNNLYY